MLKRISSSSKHILVKTISVISLALVLAVGSAGFVLADDVNINVEVKTRKPTDTINDFKLSPTAETTLTAQVLGAQSERQKSPVTLRQVLYQILVYQVACWLI